MYKIMFCHTVKPHVKVTAKQIFKRIQRIESKGCETANSLSAFEI